jgi:hypothetical protein
MFAPLEEIQIKSIYVAIFPSAWPIARRICWVRRGSWLPM